MTKRKQIFLMTDLGLMVVSGLNTLPTTMKKTIIMFCERTA